MKIFVAVDDSCGMMFNKRRQSKDKVLVDYIVKTCNGNKLWMNSYSAKQFEMFSQNIVVDEDFLSKALKDDFCFVENLQLLPFESEIETFYVCKWNRKYPSDFNFDVNLEKNFKLSKITEFAGNSHEEITVEEWVKA